MGNYNGFADKVIQSEIRKHYPHDKLLTLHDPDSGLEKIKYSELCKYRGNGLPVGSECVDGELTYYLRPYEHTMINGMSGSGKTTVFYENFFLCCAAFPNDRKSSMCYIDYKHDMLKKHKQYLLNHGYKVVSLDLIDPTHSNTWNPLEGKVVKYIEAKKTKDEKTLLETDQFIRGLGNCICPTPPETRDPMWANGAREYICALIYAIFDLAADDIIRPEDVTFENIQGLHTFIRAFWMQERSSLGSNVLTLKDIADIKPFALLGETFTKADYVAAFMTVLGCGSITGSSYMATIEPALSVLCDQSIMRVTRSSTQQESINFEEILKNPTFVSISPSGTPGSNMLISMFFDRLFDFVRTKTAHKSLERPLHVLMDEMCNLHRIDNLCTYISTTRSMQVYFHLGVQSDSMLAAKYGEFNAINLKNNVTEFFFGSQEKSTLNRFVSQGGETTTADINFRLGMCDHITFKTYNVVTTSDLSIMHLGTFYVRQARHMLLKSSMIPSFAVKEFQNSDVVQEDQNETTTISKKLDFSLLGINQESQNQDQCDDEEEKRRDEVEKRRQALMERLMRMQKDKEDEEDDDDEEDGDCDNIDNDKELQQRTLQLCVGKESISISALQRALHVNYARAGQLIEWLEREGYISAFNQKTKGRKVLITADEFKANFDESHHKDGMTFRDYDANKKTLRYRALKFCVEQGQVTVASLEGELGCGFSVAHLLIRWLIDKKYVCKFEGIDCYLSTIDETELLQELEKLSEANLIDRAQVEAEKEVLERIRTLLVNHRSAEDLPAHTFWTDEESFVAEFIKQMKVLILSNRQSGLMGAIKCAEQQLDIENALVNGKSAEVYERLIYELKHMEKSFYTQLKKKILNLN